MNRILLIDDDEAVSRAVAAALRRAGYEVETAEDGKQGEALFRKHAWDLVITDLIMPNKDGVETIMALRRLRCDFGILAITGGGQMLGTDYLRKIVANLGVIRLLTKPFTSSQLLEAVREALAVVAPGE